MRFSLYTDIGKLVYYIAWSEDVPRISIYYMSSSDYEYSSQGNEDARMSDILTNKTANLLEVVDSIRIVANTKLSSKNKSSLGQFMTPAPVAAFMSSLFEHLQFEEIRLLDPGAGIGSLTASFIERILKADTRARIVAEAFEIDDIMLASLREILSLCEARCHDKGILFNGKITNRDFIEYASERLFDRLGIFGGSLDTYTHCIMNPPYRKISSSSKHRLLLHSVGVETSNLYSAFVALAIRLLAPDGELVAIIPRSFCNGVYFRPFRQLLLESMSLRHIHVFDSRTKAFKDDDVLQENIIIYAVKQNQDDFVKITCSTDASFADLTERIVEFPKVVNPSDPDQFIHIATSELDQAVIDRVSVFNHDIAELGIGVCTGPVVDFRLEKHLEKGVTDDSYPLIYPYHFHEGGIAWPKQDEKKPNSIRDNEVTDRWLLPDGYYTLTRRFSAKEERRRIVSVVYIPHANGTGKVGFENHVNVFHQQKHGLDPLIAKGLSIFLNSTLLDLYFRQFSGHTQVNATDLRRMHYPDREVLAAWGQVFENVIINQEAIDSLVEKTINNITKRENPMDPIKVTRKIKNAIKILVDMELPKAQQNDRSALTLLALLGIKPNSKWIDAQSPLMGITPIMDFARDHYGKEYAPNTRETFRRQTIHQFVDAGIAIPNPDKPDRAINSPKWIYQIAPDALELIQAFGTDEWEISLSIYLERKKTLMEEYAKQRNMQMIPLTINEQKEITLSPGDHSQLIKDIIEQFGPRYAPGSEVLYVGDTGAKFAHFDEDGFHRLGLEFDRHGKFPDVVLYHRERNRLLLIESVTSHGPVNAKRHRELMKLFKKSETALIFVTAFPDRRVMAKYLSEISWETEVWIANSPTHLIHFNGERLLDTHG